MTGFADAKLLAINTGAFMASCCDWIEPTLKEIKKVFKRCSRKL